MALGRLDHPHYDIRLKVESLAEVHRLNSCAKEPWTVDWIERELREGDVLYDVGANIGAYSLIAARAGRGHVRIIAFEPSCTTFAALCENIAINDEEASITAFPVALGERSGLRTMKYRELQPGTANHSWDQGRAPSPRRASDAGFRQPLLSFALDELIQLFSLPMPTQVKLDVDGVELDVLKGAYSALRSPRLRSLMVELEPSLEPRVIDLLTAHGFSCRSRFTREPARAGVPAYAVFDRNDAR